MMHQPQNKVALVQRWPCNAIRLAEYVVPLSWLYIYLIEWNYATILTRALWQRERTRVCCQACIILQVQRDCRPLVPLWCWCLQYEFCCVIRNNVTVPYCTCNHPCPPKTAFLCMHTCVYLHSASLNATYREAVALCPKPQSPFSMEFTRNSHFSLLSLWVLSTCAQGWSVMPTTSMFMGTSRRSIGAPLCCFSASSLANAAAYKAMQSE